MEALLEQHVPRVFGFALRLTGDRHAAEDLTQETFLRAWRARGRLRDGSTLRVWLFQIAANAWRDQLRRRKLAPEQALAIDCDAAAALVAPDQAAENRDETAWALAALDELPPRQREVLYLAACEGCSLAEIADVLDSSADAVKSNLSLARKKMRERLAARHEARESVRSVP